MGGSIDRWVRAWRLHQRKKSEHEAQQVQKQEEPQHAAQREEERAQAYTVHLPNDSDDETEEAKDCMFYNDHARLVDQANLHPTNKKQKQKKTPLLLYQDDTVKLTCSTPPLLKLVVRPVKPLASLVSRSFNKKSLSF